MIKKIKDIVVEAREEHKSKHKNYPEEYIFIGKYSSTYKDENGSYPYTRADFFLVKDNNFFGQDNRVKVLTGPYKGDIYDMRVYTYSEQAFFHLSNGINMVTILKVEQNKLRDNCNFNDYVQDGYIQQFELDKIAKEMELSEIAKIKTQQAEIEKKKQKRLLEEMERKQKTEKAAINRKFVISEFGEDE